MFHQNPFLVQLPPEEREKAFPILNTDFDGSSDGFILLTPRATRKRWSKTPTITGSRTGIRPIAKGGAVKMVHDGDGDGFKETATLFKNGKASLQSQDTNKDG